MLSCRLPKPTTSSRVAATAEDNLNLAIDGFDRILENVSNRGNPQTLPLSLSDDESSRLVVEIHQEDIVLLNQLLSFYGQFTQRNQSTRFVAFRNAAAYHRIGKIEQRLKRFNEATESFEQAMRIYDNQLERKPDDIECVVAKAELMNDMGLAMTESLKPLGDVVAQHQAAIEFLSSRPSSVASVAEVGYQLARAYDLPDRRVSAIELHPLGSEPSERNRRVRTRGRIRSTGRQGVIRRIHDSSIATRFNKPGRHI